MSVPKSKYISTRSAEWVPSLRVRNNQAYKRKNDARAIVIHFTGAGPRLRWLKEGTQRGEPNPLRTAVRLYSTVLPNSAHYVLGPSTGLVICMSEENYVSWGVGSVGWGRYENPNWGKSPQFDWWRKKWPDLESPLDFADGKVWSGGSANENCIHIEVSPSKDESRPVWSAACLKSLRLLCEDICNRWGISFDKYHIVTHSDVHPIKRSTLAGQPWDPHPHQYSFDRMLKS